MLEWNQSGGRVFVDSNQVAIPRPSVAVDSSIAIGSNAGDEIGDMVLYYLKTQILTDEVIIDPEHLCKC